MQSTEHIGALWLPTRPPPQLQYVSICARTHGIIRAAGTRWCIVFWLMPLKFMTKAKNGYIYGFLTTYRYWWFALWLDNAPSYDTYCWPRGSRCTWYLSLSTQVGLHLFCLYCFCPFSGNKGMTRCLHGLPGLPARSPELPRRHHPHAKTINY